MALACLSAAHCLQQPEMVCLGERWRGIKFRRTKFRRGEQGRSGRGGRLAATEMPRKITGFWIKITDKTCTYMRCHRLPRERHCLCPRLPSKDWSKPPIPWAKGGTGPSQ